MKKSAPADTLERKAGRPTTAPGAGTFRRVNTSLYDEHLAIAQRIDGNISAAIRTALNYWASKHPNKP